MRLLHITATHLNLAGGIPVVLRDLVYAQNQIDCFEARVLSIKADVSAMNSEFFDYLGNSSFEDYLESYKPEVVIFHSHHYFEYTRMFRFLIKKKIPYFIEPHGSFGKAALQKSRIKKIIANRVILKKLMRYAKGYIFLNESEKTDAQFRTKHDIVIPNGINPDTNGIIMEPHEPWCFYFIGRFDINHKGLDYLFDALEVLDKQNEVLEIKLYGKGTTEEVDYINSRINNLHSIVVTNQGPIYGGDQAKLLEQCGIMILCSRYEGFPMTILEAWRYGNPCLVTPGTNVIDEVIDNNLGWGTELDVQKIAKAIKDASREYSKDRERYIAGCKNYVLNKYNWNEIAQMSYTRILDAVEKS